MSYILEALKKSESDRQQATSPPSIYSPKPAPPAEPEKDSKKTRLLLWGALSILLILLFTAGYQLYGRRMISITITVPEENTSSQDQKTTVNVEPKSAAENLTKPTAATPEIKPTDSPKTVTTEEPEESEEQSKQFSEILGPRPLLSKTANNRQYVPRLDELDIAFQKRVPEFKLAGHVYSEDATLRMILINNRIVRENGAAAKDYILEEITPGGIILRNGTVRFRIDIP